MQKKFRLLQLFAETEAQTTGDITADAGQTNEAQPTLSASRLSWGEILQDAEYKREYDASVQNIVQRRLRNSKHAEETLSRLKPVIDAVSRRYANGAELSKMDAEKLAQTILAGENRERRTKAKEHLDSLIGQERYMKAKYPDFELSKAMEDERFLRLTAPHTGLSLEDAYCALHYAEIRESEARKSLMAVSNSVRAGELRPRENTGRQSASKISDDPRTMTREQREALKKRIYDAKAQGRKLPYGG